MRLDHDLRRDSQFLREPTDHLQRQCPTSVQDLGHAAIDHDSAEQSCMGERFAPLLAAYSSDGRLQQALPPDINLTNLYRVVFNTYFGTDMPMLPNRSFFIGWKRPEQRRVVTPEEIARNCGRP